MAEETSPRRIATEFIHGMVTETMPGHQIIPNGLEPSAMVALLEVNLHPPLQAVAARRTECQDGVEVRVVNQPPLQLFHSIGFLCRHVVTLGGEVVEHGVHLPDRTNIIKVDTQQFGMRHLTGIRTVAEHAGGRCIV